MILDLFHYNPTALLAGAGVVGLAIGFGAQGLVSDIVTGFFILLEKQFDVGEYITVAGFDGIVEQIGLRTTQLRSFDGTLHFIPNRSILNVSNHSRGTMTSSGRSGGVRFVFPRAAYHCENRNNGAVAGRTNLAQKNERSTRYREKAKRTGFIIYRFFLLALLNTLFYFLTNFISRHT